MNADTSSSSSCSSFCHIKEDVNISSDYDTRWWPTAFMQSINLSIYQSINQSINQSIHTVPHPSHRSCVTWILFWLICKVRLIFLPIQEECCFYIPVSILEQRKKKKILSWKYKLLARRTSANYSYLRFLRTVAWELDEHLLVISFAKTIHKIQCARRTSLGM